MAVSEGTSDPVVNEIEVVLTPPPPPPHRLTIVTEETSVKEVTQALTHK